MKFPYFSPVGSHLSSYWTLGRREEAPASPRHLSSGTDVLKTYG